MNLPFRNYPGWEGMFTRDQAPGALANDTRIMKTNSEPGDAMPDGTLGTVLGSLSHPDVMDGVTFYFVEWDHMPRRAVGIAGHKIRAAS
jgi:hypothetical protein